MSTIVYIPHTDQYGKLHDIGSEFVTVDLLGDYYGTRASYKKEQIEFVSDVSMDTLMTRIYVLEKDIAELFERNKELERRINYLMHYVEVP